MGADGAWRWRRGVEDKYHYRFWGQVARWMAYQRNMAQGDKMRLFFAPDRPRTNGTLTLNANVISLSGEPLREGAVIAQIVSPSGKPASVRILLPAGAEAWGLFTGTFTPSEPGDYRVRLTCAEAGMVLGDHDLRGSKFCREKRGSPARPEVLRELAVRTRGKFIETTDPAKAPAEFLAIPEEEMIDRRLQLWAHPAWAGTLIALLALFWAGRKAAAGTLPVQRRLHPPVCPFAPPSAWMWLRGGGTPLPIFSLSLCLLAQLESIAAQVGTPF